MANGKIFISYRREDTSGESGRLKDKLEQVFGHENIFYDVETLEAGLNFDQSIAKALSESKVLLAMIGPHWLKVADSKGTIRLLKEDDWVRKEISEAIKRNLRVIPILVNGADMPNQDELPDDLKELTLKHAQELSSSRWNYDVGELTKVLEKIIAKNPESKPHPNPRPISPPIAKPKGWWAKNYLWVLGGVVAFFILIGMCTPEQDYTTPIDSLDQTSADPRITNPEGSEIHESLSLESPQNRTTESAAINIVYRGDNYGCILNLEITIGAIRIIPTGNQFRVSGVPAGNQSYTITGQINCQTVPNCMASGEGVVPISENGTYYVVWQNVGENQCTMMLQPQ